MRNLENYKSIQTMNKALIGEVTYSVFMHGVSFFAWFDEFGIVTEKIDELSQPNKSTAIFNFSCKVADDYPISIEADQIVLSWPSDIGRQFCYKGLVAVEDEIIYIDTYQLSTRPTVGETKKIVIPRNSEGKEVFKRGMCGTIPGYHERGRFLRSVVNLTDQTKGLSYSDNADLSESKPFSPVVSSGTLQLIADPSEWGYDIIRGEKNSKKIYEVVTRQPVYLFSGNSFEKVCDFVAFSSSFNIVPHTDTVEIRIADKTSLYWNEEITISHHFSKSSVKSIISKLLEYREDMITFPSVITDENLDFENSLFKVSNLNTKNYKYYKDIFSDICQELLFRISFDSHENIVLQSEAVLGNAEINKGTIEAIKNATNIYELNETDNIFGIERSTSSNIIYNKIDNKMIEYKTFYDGNFFKLPTVHYVNNITEAKLKANEIVTARKSHDMYIYDISTSRLYMAIYGFMYDEPPVVAGKPNQGPTITWVKNHSNQKDYTFTQEEIKDFKTPIKYAFSKIGELAVVSSDTNGDDIFSTYSIGLSKEEAELLNPYSASGEYAVVTDGINDFHARVISIDKNPEYTGIENEFTAIIVFGYTKDRNYNFTGKIYTFANYVHSHDGANYSISYKLNRKYTIFFARKELPYVWQYKNQNTVDYVNVPIFGSDTFEVYGNFGGIDTDDGKFAKMVDDIEKIYNSIFELDYHSEYSQMFPVYLRNIMMGPGKYEYGEDSSEFENFWVSDYSNKYIMLQILRSKPTDILPKDTFLTTIKDRNSGNSDFYMRITTLLGAGKVKLTTPYKEFPKGKIFSIVDDLKESKAYKTNKEDLFDYYICYEGGSEIKIPKLLAETISANSSHQNLTIDEAAGKAILVKKSIFDKVAAGDILFLSEPTPENYGTQDYNHPTLTLLYQKYKNAKWIIKSREKTIHGEYLLYLDYAYPGDKISGTSNFTMKFDIIKGYINGDPYKSGYTLLQEVSIKGNPILEYTQNYYYENSKSVDKYGEKKYQGITGKFMSSINDVNVGVSYILNSFSGLDESSTKSLIPIQSSHVIGLNVLDYVRVRDDVYNTIDSLGIVVGKDYSIDSSSLKFTYKVFNVSEYDPIVGADLIEVSEYKPIKYPKYGYKEDGGWESTGQSITKNDQRIGEVKYKRIDPSVLSATTTSAYNESTSINLKLSGLDSVAKEFIQKAGDNIIIEHLGKQHLLMTKTEVRDSKVELIFSIKNLFSPTESEMDDLVSIPNGTSLELFQVVTVLSEIDSLVDKVEDLEEDMDDVVGDDGILSPEYPPLPTNIRVEPAINGFYVKLFNPDKSMVKGYNIYYKRTTESELNYKKEWIGLNSTYLIGGLSANREGTIKYNAYLKSVSHKGIESIDSSIVFVVAPRVLEFDDIYYPPGQSPAEQEGARKELAEILGSQLSKLEDIASALDGKYGSIVEDLDENYFTKKETDTEISIGMGNVKTDVTNQTVEMINSNWTQTQDLISSSVSGLEVQLTELGGRINKTETEINQTKELLELTAKKLEAKIDGNYQIITEKMSSLEIAAEQIKMRVEQISTELDGLDGKVTREFTEINQTAKKIELMAQRTSADFNKAELMTSNFIFNSGDFVNEDKPVKLPDGSWKLETKPMYWNYSGREDVVSILDDNGTKILHTTRAEGFTYTGVTKLRESKLRNEDEHGVKVPGNSLYVLSANVKVLNPAEPNGYLSTLTDPIKVWISEKDKFTTEGVNGVDYEIFTLQEYNEKKDEIIKNQLDNKYQEYLPPDDIRGESKYKTPFINQNEWANVAIVILLKGSDANKFNLKPTVSSGEGIVDIKIKNIQLRMGDQLKEWEPALAQMLDAENMVSYINITPDEIKLDSKLIKIGGGIVVEGENVAIKYLSAARLQLGENFMFDEGDRDENGNLIPDTERLMIKKVQIGQIDSLKPDGNGGSLSLEEYIKVLDNAVADKAAENLEIAKDAIDLEVKDAKDRANASKKLMAEISEDGKVAGAEKVELSKEYKSLEIRGKSLESQTAELNKIITDIIQNKSLSDSDKVTLDSLKVDYSIIKERIYGDMVEDSLFKYLKNIVKINEKHTKETLIEQFGKYEIVEELLGSLTTTTIIPETFSRYWNDAYNSIEAILLSIQKSIDGMSKMGIANAATAFDQAKKAENDARLADEAAKKAQEQADISMATVRTMSSDGILTAEEKSVLSLNWLELEESCRKIITGITSSTMKPTLKTDLIKKLNDGVLSGKDSLFTYLTNLNFFDLTTKVETTIVDTEGKSITKTIYGSRLPDGQPTAGKYFDNCWNSAYAIRQEVLNEIQDFTMLEMAEANKQAILSMYGMYDSEFRHCVRNSDESTTVHLYTSEIEGKEPDKIDHNLTVDLIEEAAGKIKPVFPVGFSINYKNAMPIIDLAKEHYEISVAASGLDGGSTNFSYGAYFLNDKHQLIEKTVFGTYETSSQLKTSVIFSGDVESTFTPLVKISGPRSLAKYIRPFIYVNSGSKMIAYELRIRNAQDLVNSDTIKDVFADGKVTPDEKLELSRIKKEVQKEYNQLFSLIESASAVDMYKANISSDGCWIGNSGYKKAYNDMTSMLNNFTADMNVITQVASRDSEINEISGLYYEKKERLVSKMTEVARQTAKDESGAYTDAREDYIQNEIDNGKIVLNGNTTILGGLKIKSSESHSGNQSPVWTPNADYLELGGGKIKFFRGIGKNPSQINDANYTKITEIGPHVWGEAKTSAQADSLSGNALRHFVDISLPFLKPSRTKVMLSQKTWELTKNVRSISLRAVKLTQGSDSMSGGLYANTWRLYLEGVEEEFESYIERSYAGTSFSCETNSYYMSILSCKFQGKANNNFSVRSRIYSSDTRYRDSKPTIFNFIITVSEPHTGITVSKSFKKSIQAKGSNYYDESVPASVLNFDDMVSTIKMHTNRSDKKNVSIRVELIDVGQADYVYWGTGEDGIPQEESARVVYEITAQAIIDKMSVGGLYEYSNSINVSTIAAGEITYYAFEETYDTIAPR